MKIRTLRFLSKEGVSNVVKNKLMSLASTVTVVISLLLLGLVLLVAINVNSNMEKLRQELEVVIFLEVDVNGFDREAIRSFIESRVATGEVAEWRFEDKETAFASLKASFSDPSMLKGMTKDQMAESFFVRLSDPDQGARFVEPLSKLPGIQPAPDGINYPYETLMQITRFSDVLNSVTIFLMGIMVIIALFIISNTIRLTVLSRSKEIEIMKHVGALDSFIRMPFFVEGIVIGVLGAITAFFMTEQSYIWMKGVFNNVMDELGLGLFQLVPFAPLAMRIVLVYLLIGVAIGGAGSLLSIRKYLKV